MRGANPNNPNSNFKLTQDSQNALMAHLPMYLISHLASAFFKKTKIIVLSKTHLLSCTKRLPVTIKSSFILIIIDKISKLYNYLQAYLLIIQTHTIK